MHKTLKKYIKAGYDNNIIVVKTKGKLTMNLLNNMREVADENELRLDTLYIPKSAVNDVFQPGNRLYGFYLHVAKIDMDYYTIDLEARMPPGAKQLVVAVGDEHVLLGAY